MSYLESSARPVSFAAVLVAVDVAGLLAIAFAPPLFFPVGVLSASNLRRK